MGSTIELTAADGAKLSAYRATPAGKPRGGLVVVQEIFGVNPHVRSVVDRYAQQGYDAIAPALFDRVAPGVELPYNQDAMQQGRGYVGQLGGWDKPLLDIAAAVKAVQGAGKVGVVGYCWGGTLAYLAAAKVDGVAAGVGYYGSSIKTLLDVPSRAPVLLHFGANDGSVTPEDLARLRERHPEITVHTYPGAGHAFNRDVDPHVYEPASAKLALERTLAFLHAHVG